MTDGTGSGSAGGSIRLLVSSASTPSDQEPEAR